MATSNFGRCNTSVIYAIMPDRECVNECCEGECDCAETSFESDWEWAQEHMADEFSKIGRNCDEWLSRDRRKIAEVSESTTISGIPIELIFECQYESGYYEGVMLDYTAKIHVGRYSYDFELSDNSHMDCINDDAKYTAIDYDMNKGLLKIHINNAVKKWIDKASKRLIEQIERIYSDVATNKLKVVARFSNGETIYQNVQNERK